MHSRHCKPWLRALCCFLLSSILVAFQTALRDGIKTQHAQQPLEHIEIPNAISNSNNLSNNLSNLHDDVKLTSFSELPETSPKGSTRYNKIDNIHQVTQFNKDTNDNYPPSIDSSIDSRSISIT